jgi:hypothetical protein
MFKDQPHRTGLRENFSEGTYGQRRRGGGKERKEGEKEDQTKKSLR